ncbi:MAG: hypothetical protein Q8M22_10400 [Actinomycetota bacterium]|nr:hypothetical protein [Actinomycetota bacterium]
MTALPEVRRRRTGLMVAANVLALAALGGMTYAGVTALRNYEGATKVSVESTKLPVTPTAMLATVDADDTLTTITVLVLSPGTQVGGSIVSVPASSDSTAGGAEVRVPLTQIYAEGGVDALAQAVESVLSVTLDRSSVVAPDELEALLQPVAPIAVELPADVVGADSDPLFDAGPVNLTAAEAARVFTAVSDTQTDAERRGNVQALWGGVASSVGAGRTSPEAASPLADTATMPEFIERLFAGPVQARGLPANPVPVDEVPEGVDVDELDRAEAIFVLASVASASMSAPSPGLVFRIEAPPGTEERVKVAVAAVLYLGGNVQSVTLGGETFPETRILVADESLTEEAESNNAYFGTTVTRLADPPIEGIDVILQLGTEFLDGQGDALPSTTSTTEST